MVRYGTLFFVVCLMFGTSAQAQEGLLWGNAARPSLLAPRVDPTHTVSANNPALFAGTTGHSLFAPYPVRHKAPQGHQPLGDLATPASQIRDLIASAEAGAAGYDAVVWAARVKPPKPPSQMTVGEIYDWIKATPRQHHAIGRYQFIPSTLRRLVGITGAGRDQPFTPQYQDRLADILLAEAGMHRYHAREIGRVTFMNNLAKIWAGFPNASGRSHYHGFAGNKATMSWATFSQEMAAIYDS